MSNYTDFLEKTTSHKIVLFEFDNGVLLGDNLWVKHAPGVWKTTYSWETGKAVTTTAYGKGTWGAGTWGKASATTLPTAPRDVVNIIGSLEINLVKYILVSALSSVATTPDSFYWDKHTQLLYVNYNGYIRDPGNDIVVGITYGYAKNSIYFNDNYYSGRIKSIPKISVKRDNLFNGKVVTVGGSVTLTNTDGEFDDFSDSDIYGQKIKIKFGGDDLIYDDYETIYTGYLEDHHMKNNNIVINIKDERKNLEREIPNTYYETAPHVGDEIAIGYGIINRAQAVCTNEEVDESTTYSFKFVDTTHHDIESIGQVYVDGVRVDHTSGSLVNGTFILAGWDGIDSYTVYEPGQDVSVSFHGYTDGVDLIDNPLDIIEDLLEIYANVIYSSDFYNTIDWDILKPTLDNINLFVKKSKTLKDIIGDISHSILGTFIVEGDGRFNMKVVDLTKAVVKTIAREELLGKVAIDYPSKNYISSARVGYARACTNDKYSYFTNTGEEDRLSKKYRSYKQKDFSTLLTTSAAASDYSDTVMALFGGIIPEYTITTKMQNIDVEIEDNINIDISRYNEAAKIVKVEVVSKAVNYTKNTVTFNCVFIEDV